MMEVKLLKIHSKVSVATLDSSERNEGCSVLKKSMALANR
jgi:hypothetical protein